MARQIAAGNEPVSGITGTCSPSFLNDIEYCGKDGTPWNSLTQIALLGKGLGKSSTCNQRRTKMANPRQEEKATQDMEDAARRAGEKAAEQPTRIGQAAADQTARVGQAAAETGQEVARASANLLKQNVETLQNAWRSGLEAATSVMGRSTEQVGRTFGLSGEGVQQAEQATERSARNAQTCFTAAPLLPE